MDAKEVINHKEDLESQKVSHSIFCADFGEWKGSERIRQSLSRQCSEKAAAELEDFY